MNDGTRLGEFAGENARVTDASPNRRIPSYQITVNDRLDDKERFVTIAHELGHIFCGHLGGYGGPNGRDEEGGWPDRRTLGHHEKEIEAEAVAYLLASNAGIIPASAKYLKVHASRADISRINEPLIIRSVGRIERLAKIRYGSVRFK